MKPHHIFKREGLNIISEVPLTLTQAILGAKLTIDTLDGKLNIEAHPGTNDGEELVLRFIGVQPFHPPENYDINDLRGDHIVKFRVQMP